MKDASGAVKATALRYSFEFCFNTCEQYDLNYISTAVKLMLNQSSRSLSSLIGKERFVKQAKA